MCGFSVTGFSDGGEADAPERTATGFQDDGFCAAAEVPSPRRSPAGHQQRREGALCAAAGRRLPAAPLFWHLKRCTGKGHTSDLQTVTAMV